MTPQLRILIGAALLLGTAAVVDAHHSFSPVYDASRTVTVAGTVTAFRLINPHAQMVLDVTDEAGKVVAWNVEFPGRLHLTNGAWTDDSIKVGEHVSVTGNPTHTGSARMFFVQLQHADGSLLEPPAVARGKTLDEERRQRIEQREQPAADGR